MYQPMIFQGEEMSIGIRGFTIGYDYYAPQVMISSFRFTYNVSYLLPLTFLNFVPLEKCLFPSLRITR